MFNVYFHMCIDLFQLNPCMHDFPGIVSMFLCPSPTSTLLLLSHNPPIQLHAGEINYDTRSTINMVVIYLKGCGSKKENDLDLRANRSYYTKKRHMQERKKKKQGEERNGYVARKKGGRET